ncbi:MAG TPA: CBS domain-containing protein [Solirubrobacteraceae bacterium]
MTDTAVHTAILPYHGSYLMPSLEHAKVSDAMHPGILSCPADATLTEVARMMVTHHVHCLAVMNIARDESGESLVWGIISDLDLMRAGTRGEGEPRAAALAAQPIISVKPSMPLRDAAELMLSREVTHLIVVEPASERPIGILSPLDVAGALAWGES